MNPGHRMRFFCTMQHVLTVYTPDTIANALWFISALALKYLVLIGPDIKHLASDKGF